MKNQSKYFQLYGPYCLSWQLFSSDAREQKQQQNICEKLDVAVFL